MICVPRWVEVPFNSEVNGWSYNPSTTYRAAMEWTHPTEDKAYVGWDKTGGNSWSAWLSVPGELPKDTVFRSFGTPEEALQEAERITKAYSPEQALEEDW